MLVLCILSILLNLKFIVNKDKDKYSIGVSENGKLSVKDGQLVNEDGKIMRLKGMSSHGLMWYPEYTNYRSLKTIRDYGANVFRIAMYTEQNKGYIYNSEESKKILINTIENVLGADMYAIVDWHTLKDNNPNANIEKAKEFFDEVSRRYKDEPGVIYEIFNEPSGDTSWQDIKDYANTIIPIIRKNSPNSIILVGTPNYCVDLKSPINDPLEYDNIMYTYHLYTGSCEGGYKYLIEEAIKNNIAVFVSEWGLSPEKGTNNIDFNKATEFLDYLKKNNISWVNWSLSNKDEPYSAIDPNVEKLSGWNLNDLTESGKFIFDSLSKK
ncbi:glycoside hydrolase family 5 protein [Romboutsia hominis]|uniref:glycoside hydrolase family 5 protein n=1 Tax=Romboutsia hominis TaxID=1507512 RepID=UPI001F06BA6F|nr:glycoside hydrolase family 5 protein [Romboutsia hominis]MCH1960610.1 glycoside hydrolase family 5 protein [Romboutsia hominis]MCH1968958.1 glycoside hydrolase family 5 protein [Romboutsia hominis]